MNNDLSSFSNNKYQNREISVRELRTDPIAESPPPPERSQELPRIEFQSLTENERLFHTALDQFPGVFNIYDADRRLVYVNAEASRVSGLRFDQLIGFRDEELIPPETTSRDLLSYGIARSDRNSVFHRHSGYSGAFRR